VKNFVQPVPNCILTKLENFYRILAAENDIIAKQAPSNAVFFAGDGSSANGARTECINKLSVQTAEMFGNPYAMDAMLGPVITANTSADCQLFGIPPFFIKSGMWTFFVVVLFIIPCTI
jgi:hypothetical protein